MTTLVLSQASESAVLTTCASSENKVKN